MACCTTRARDEAAPPREALAAREAAASERKGQAQDKPGSEKEKAGDSPPAKAVAANPFAAMKEFHSKLEREAQALHANIQKETQAVLAAAGLDTSDKEAAKTHAAAERGQLKLVVKVDRAEGLMGVDVSLNAKMMIERTVDPYVTLRVNQEPAFGKTEIKWKSKGDASWDQTFSASLPHPRSWLCLDIVDSDPVFRDGPLALKRSVGFLEIPLWSMPRNKPVVGWFTLNHPETQDQDGTPEEKQKRAEERAEQERKAGHAQASAGRVRLELLLETTFSEEVKSYMGPAPTFQAALPPLNLPKFLEDVTHAKKLAVDRLALVAFASFKYAFSWENPLLSFGILCWYWFLFHFPRFTYPTLVAVLLLCFFFHPAPEEKPAESSAAEAVEEPTEAMEGKSSVEKMAMAHFKKMQKDFKKGVEDIEKKAEGLKEQLSKGGLGLQELQQVLLLRPDLRDQVRGLQKPATAARAGLEAVESIIYWGARRGSPKTTSIVVAALVGLLVASFVVSCYLDRLVGLATWWFFLILGSVAILANATAFQQTVVRGIKVGVAVLQTLARPPAPFPGYAWFELAA